MNELKITIIGAGSTYTPELIEGFIKRQSVLNVESFYFMDINAEKMEIVAGLCKRMLNKAGFDGKIVLTDNLEKAIKDADYILGQVRVGGLDARISDEKIPLKYGLLGQETTGAGGFMKAMRTIPVIMNIVRIIEKLAPNAWFINFSNPSGLIAEAVLNNSNIKMMGLCNVPINLVKDSKKLLPEWTKGFDYDFIGLNHLCWITGIYADDKEILNDMINDEKQILKVGSLFDYPIDPALLKATRGIPTGYMNYYYNRDEQVHKCSQAQKSRGEIVKEIEEKLLELYKRQDLDTKPEELKKRGGALYSEAAVSLVDAIENDKKEIHVVDVKNAGAYDFMGDDDVVEVKCVVDKNGATPIKHGKFDNQYITGLMQCVKSYEKLAAKAGLEGNYEKALAALMVHPLIGDFSKAKGVLDEMLKANRKYLPQFQC